MGEDLVPQIGWKQVHDAGSDFLTAILLPLIVSKKKFQRTTFQLSAPWKPGIVTITRYWLLIIQQLFIEHCLWSSL